jgi:hypothetical protein
MAGDSIARFGDLEFMVSFDFFINETTRHAHVILPAGVCTRARSLRHRLSHPRHSQHRQVLARGVHAICRRHAGLGDSVGNDDATATRCARGGRQAARRRCEARGARTTRTARPRPPQWAVRWRTRQHAVGSFTRRARCGTSWYRPRRTRAMPARTAAHTRPSDSACARAAGGRPGASGSVGGVCCAD